VKGQKKPAQNAPALKNIVLKLPYSFSSSCISFNTSLSKLSSTGRFKNHTITHPKRGVKIK